MSLLATLVLGAALVVSPTQARAEDTCSAAQEQLQTWLDANKETLPTTLDDISRYPMEYRRAIQGALSPQQRVALWREHLHRYIASHPRLNARQLAALELTLAVLTPELFTVDDTPEVLRAQAAVRDAFDAKEAQLIVATLGPSESSGVEESAAPVCTCNGADSWCGGTICRGSSCRRTTSGCGWLNRKPCNGRCG
ncbi:bacteriocin fulvocin C-related protein [Myxococcus landrumensis]|uniref:Bacteriocin fulvocin C-related protein n=1 Tax=Myxococcus landrumensis TaxID=2813577 RepID=A0ABX7N731_9BACT|nr:bacteriocin fulvocin C-related protein [Myxococcus landrumus]QSQ14535.1 bacteriocin fulvocin C-related protein [Myxococcus landrumus]